MAFIDSTAAGLRRTLRWEDVLEEGLRVYFLGWRTLLPIGLAEAGLLTLVVHLEPTIGSRLIGSREWEVPLLLLPVLHALVTGALIGTVGHLYRGERPSVVGALFFGAKNFWSVLSAIVAIHLAVSLGWIVLIVPGLWFAAAAALTVPILVLEGVSFPVALSRSFELTRGNRSCVVVLWIVGWLAAFGAGWVGQFIVWAVPGSLQWVVESLVGSIVLAATLGIVAAWKVVLYVRLRALREDFDAPNTLEWSGEHDARSSSTSG